MKVIAEVNEGEDSLYVTVYSYDRTAILCMIVLLFLLTLSLIGGRKGVYSAVALIFTFVCIIFLFFATYLQRGISCLGSSTGRNSDDGCDHVFTGRDFK